MAIGNKINYGKNGAQVSLTWGALEIVIGSMVCIDFKKFSPDWFVLYFEVSRFELRDNKYRVYVEPGSAVCVGSNRIPEESDVKWVRPNKIRYPDGEEFEEYSRLSLV